MRYILGTLFEGRLLAYPYPQKLDLAVKTCQVRTLYKFCKLIFIMFFNSPEGMAKEKHYSLFYIFISDVKISFKRLTPGSLDRCP
jgi:hypothetical protein